jgi:hypothetical protein
MSKYFKGAIFGKYTAVSHLKHGVKLLDIV